MVMSLNLLLNHQLLVEIGVTRAKLCKEMVYCSLNIKFAEQKTKGGNDFPPLRVCYFSFLTPLNGVPSGFCAINRPSLVSRLTQVSVLGL